MTKLLCSRYFFLLIDVQLLMENKIDELKAMIEDNEFVYCSLWT